MSNKLFEEALADAKKLKEVAEENAKRAILESVTPKIREFIEGQLLESDNSEISEKLEINEEESNEVMHEIDLDSELKDLDEDIVLDENSLNSLVEMLGGTKILESLQEGQDVLDASIKSTLQNLSKSERSKLIQLADKINEGAETLEQKHINNTNRKENSDMKKEKFYEVDLRALREAVEDEMSEMYMEEEEVDEGGSYDIDEEELMQEIKLLLDLGDDIDEDALPEELRGMLMDEEEGEEAPELDAEAPDLEDEGEMPELPPLEDEGEMPADLNEVFEVDPQVLRQELQRIRQQLAEGNIEDQFGGKGEGKAGVDGAFGGKGKSNAGVKGAFGGGKEGQDVFTNPPHMNKLNEAIRQLRRQNRSQKEKLNKYRSAVQTLREQLEDLNLFNAKLLYVNKLLQNKGLTESQKKSVIKALDEAKSLNETKSLYKSLTESLGSKKTINESTRFGSSSKTTTSSSKSALKESVAGDLARWQKLAGL